MKTLALLLLTTHLYAKDCITKPCSLAANYAYDIIGTPDNRPDTWGTAEGATKPIVFSPPPGYRVRILRAQGDFVTWPRGVPGVDPTDKVVGTAVGVLFGLSSTTPDGSSQAQGGAASDNCFLYIQDASKGEKTRAPFDYDTHVGGLLMADNTLSVRVAVWLNTTGLAIHMEPSLVLIFQYELITQ